MRRKKKEEGEWGREMGGEEKEQSVREEGRHIVFKTPWEECSFPAGLSSSGRE